MKAIEEMVLAGIRIEPPWHRACSLSQHSIGAA
jgi:hypothetical protein